MQNYRILERKKKENLTHLTQFKAKAADSVVIPKQLRF